MGCGRNRSGELGLEKLGDIKEFVELKIPEKITNFFCGYYHMLLKNGKEKKEKMNNE